MASQCLDLPNSLTYLTLLLPWLYSIYILPSPGTALPRKSRHHAPHSLTSDPSSSHILQKSIDLIMASSPWTDPTTFPLPYPLLTPYHSSHELSFHDLLWSLVIPLHRRSLPLSTFTPLTCLAKPHRWLNPTTPAGTEPVDAAGEHHTTALTASFSLRPPHCTGILVNVPVCSLPHCLQFLLCPYTSIIP